VRCEVAAHPRHQGAAAECTGGEDFTAADDHDPASVASLVRASAEIPLSFI